MNHPQVEIIWNFFPFSMLIWGPLREIGNFVFILFRIPTLPLSFLSNTIFETGPFLIVNILMMVFIGPKEWWIIMVTNGLIFTYFTNLRLGLFWLADLIGIIEGNIESEAKVRECEKNFNYQGDFLTGTL